jgi:hypothetical protein
MEHDLFGKPVSTFPDHALGAGPAEKKGRPHLSVKPPHGLYRCCDRCRSYGSVPTIPYTAMQPVASTPPPAAQTPGTVCPVKAVLAIGT